MASSLSTVSPCQKAISTGSLASARASTGQPGSDAKGVVVVVTLVAGGVVAGCSPSVVGGGSEPSPVGAVVSGGEAVGGGTGSVVAAGVSFPATMIESPEPHAAASSEQATTTQPSCSGRSLIPSPRPRRVRG